MLWRQAQALPTHAELDFVKFSTAGASRGKWTQLASSLTKESPADICGLKYETIDFSVSL